MLEFKLPDFLDESDEEIHERMLQVAPRNFDVSQGSLFFDLTKPTALEKSKMIEFQLTLFAMMMFPQFAEGVYLDYHGVREGIDRRPPVRSSGLVTFTGSPFLNIPEGTIVSTAGTENSEGIEFRTIGPLMLSDTGVGKAEVESVLAGLLANVPPESIVNIVTSGLDGISSVLNEEAITGGTNVESDDSYKERILNSHRNKQLSGAPQDYVTWAKEVPGVGEVIVLPEWNGPGTVKVLITDSTGGLANADLIKVVKEYIAPDTGNGKAPIGATVTVETVNRHLIDLSATLTIASGYDSVTVINEIKERVSSYFSSVSSGGLVFYAQVGAIIINTSGVTDYANLLINNGTANIQLVSGEIAILGVVTL